MRGGVLPRLTPRDVPRLDEPFVRAGRQVYLNVVTEVVTEVFTEVVTEVVTEVPAARYTPSSLLPVACKEMGLPSVSANGSVEMTEPCRFVTSTRPRSHRYLVRGKRPPSGGQPEALMKQRVPSEGPTSPNLAEPRRADSGWRLGSGEGGDEGEGEGEGFTDSRRR